MNAAVAIPTLDDLAEMASVYEIKPRVHGNGFLQFDLSATHRLHIWDDRLPRQATRSSIHDHAFDLRSTVLLGQLYHIEWREFYTPDGVHMVYRAHAQEGTNNTILQPTGERVNLTIADERWIEAGETYDFPALRFHDSASLGVGENRVTATIMEKISKKSNYNPRVLIPVGKTPDNEFDREGQDQTLLWRVIADTMHLINEREA